MFRSVWSRGGDEQQDWQYQIYLHLNKVWSWITILLHFPLYVVLNPGWRATLSTSTATSSSRSNNNNKTTTTAIMIPQSSSSTSFHSQRETRLTRKHQKISQTTNYVSSVGSGCGTAGGAVVASSTRDPQFESSSKQFLFIGKCIEIRARIAQFLANLSTSATQTLLKFLDLLKIRFSFKLLFSKNNIFHLLGKLIFLLQMGSLLSVDCDGRNVN